MKNTHYNPRAESLIEAFGFAAAIAFFSLLVGATFALVTRS